MMDSPVPQSHCIRELLDEVYNLGHGGRASSDLEEDCNQQTMFSFHFIYFLINLMNRSSKAKHFPPPALKGLLLCFVPVQTPGLLARFPVPKINK